MTLHSTTAWRLVAMIGVVIVLIMGAILMRQPRAFSNAPTHPLLTQAVAPWTTLSMPSFPKKERPTAVTPSAPAPEPAVMHGPPLPVPTICATCGTVVRIDPIPHPQEAGDLFQVTVNMQDGSVRTVVLSSSMTLGAQVRFESNRLQTDDH